MDISAAFADAIAAPVEPDWRIPNDFYVNEAREFIDSPDGLPLDPAVAIALLKLPFKGDFHRYRRWYEGWRTAVASPEKTVPGTTAAGEDLSDALERGETIAVYCDYDVDGTSAGEALRLGLAPYLAPNGATGQPAWASATAANPAEATGQARMIFGYADAQQGFGLTSDFVRQAHDAGAKVIITLDCGSGQGAQVRLAQSLGMKVFVVDHHGVDPDNPADHHLNPRLHEPMSSENTGAQLAWKLAAATQIAREGKTRPEHWERAMFCAGMGCNADMASPLLEENRAFLWAAHEHVPPGVAALAATMGEDPTVPGAMVRTQAIMNLPKRTPNVSAEDVGALFAAQDAEQAAPIIAKLSAAYEAAYPVRQEMERIALEQTGVKTRDEHGDDLIPDPDDRIAFVVFGEQFGDYNGYSGVVANRVSSKCGKPAFVFVRKGVDDHGQTLYRFSSRNDARVQAKLGELADSDAMLEACTIKSYDESGDVVEGPKCGGHTEVFSGTCTEENLPKVMQAARDWADETAKKGWYPQPWTGAEASLLARKVEPERLADIERQMVRLAPFVRKPEKLFSYQTRNGQVDVKSRNTQPAISVEGELKLTGQTDPDNDAWLVGELDLGRGVTREVRYPADADTPPEGKRCEWVLRVGKPGAYWLRLFNDPQPAS